LESGVHKTEEAAPLWDIHRQDLYAEFKRATHYYAYLRANYNPRQPREMNEEKQLRESLYNLWGMIRTKVFRRVNKKKYYQKLFELDNYQSKPRTTDLFDYYKLIAWFLEEYGITKVDNENYKFESSHAILKGFVKK
jgi:hypothetical protein